MLSRTRVPQVPRLIRPAETLAFAAVLMEDEGDKLDLAHASTPLSGKAQAGLINWERLAVRGGRAPGGTLRPEPFFRRGRTGTMSCPQ